MLYAILIYGGKNTMAYKYYHKIVQHDTYFLDGLYINWALPSKQLYNLQYSKTSREFIAHKVPTWNKYKKHYDFLPSPSTFDSSDPYSFVKVFLSFCKTTIESELNIISKNQNIKDTHFLESLIKFKNIKKEFGSGFTRGVRIHIGKNHNLKIYFDGKFFKHDSLKKDLNQVQEVATLIDIALSTFIFNIPEWKIDKPRFTIFQLHLAENLYKERKLGRQYYGEVTRKNALYPASKKMKEQILKDSRSKPGSWEIPKEFNPLGTEIVSGFNNGIKGKLYVSCYDKQQDTAEGRRHALIRFGTDKFWRREFQIGTKKLESVKVKFLGEFLVQMRCSHFLSNIIRKCRISVDIIVNGDSKKYLRFHDKMEYLSKKDKRDIENPLRFHNKKFTRMKIDTIGHDQLSVKPYNPYSNITGLLKNHGNKLLPNQIIHICQMAIAQVLQNSRSEYDHSPNNSTLNNHMEGLELIKNLEKFMSNFNSYDTDFLSTYNQLLIDTATKGNASATAEI